MGIVFSYTRCVVSKAVRLARMPPGVLSSGYRGVLHLFSVRQRKGYGLRCVYRKRLSANSFLVPLSWFRALLLWGAPIRSKNSA